MKKKLETLRWFTIFFSILSLPCYFLLKGIDLASTPIIVTTSNSTNEELSVYYISFYQDYEPKVRHDKCIKPNKSITTSFEIEGAFELWLVAINDNGGVRDIEIANDELYENRQFVIRDTPVDYLKKILSPKH